MGSCTPRRAHAAALSGCASEISCRNWLLRPRGGGAGPETRPDPRYGCDRCCGVSRRRRRIDRACCVPKADIRRCEVGGGYPPGRTRPLTERTAH
jgi:hypothetical protein